MLPLHDVATDFERQTHIFVTEGLRGSKFERALAGFSSHQGFPKQKSARRG